MMYSHISLVNKLTDITFWTTIQLLSSSALILTLKNLLQFQLLADRAEMSQDQTLNSPMKQFLHGKTHLRSVIPANSGEIVLMLAEAG
jgi:hypothetical protein